MSSPPGLGQFKPPPLPIPGMMPQMYGAGQRETEEQKKEKEERINFLVEQVREMQGRWQDRARAIQKLQGDEGLSSEDIYDATFVSYPRQTAMVVAAQVYESLVLHGASEDVLQPFDSEPRVELLYALRTLSAPQRRLAAEFVLLGGLDVTGANELAKAIKMHERTPAGREGFTSLPGDCLAFSYFRAASECTDPEVRENLVTKGLAFSASESARLRFAEL